VPHLARRIFGADGRASLPGALLIGGAFGLVCDTLARMLLKVGKRGEACTHIHAAVKRKPRNKAATALKSKHCR